MVSFYMILKKSNEIQLTKNKMDLNNRKIKNHAPSPEYTLYSTQDNCPTPDEALRTSASLNDNSSVSFVN